MPGLVILMVFVAVAVPAIIAVMLALPGAEDAVDGTTNQLPEPGVRRFLYLLGHRGARRLLPNL
jgi:hypothetical protein